jgi:hypothetical protein
MKRLKISPLGQIIVAVAIVWSVIDFANNDLLKAVWWQLFAIIVLLAAEKL